MFVMLVIRLYKAIFTILYFVNTSLTLTALLLMRVIVKYNNNDVTVNNLQYIDIGMLCLK